MAVEIELRPLVGGARPAVPEFLAAVVETKASLMRWMPWCHANYGSDDVERWYEMAGEMWRSRSAFPMAIVAADDGRLLGGVGLHDLQLFGKREGEVGYWVRQSARGQGVAAVAMRAMAAFAFNEMSLVRVSLRIRLDNRASRRAAERAQARFEGVLRHGLLHGEARLDAALYSLLPADLQRPWAP